MASTFTFLESTINPSFKWNYSVTKTCCRDKELQREVFTRMYQLYETFKNDNENSSLTSYFVLSFLYTYLLFHILQYMYIHIWFILVQLFSLISTKEVLLSYIGQPNWLRLIFFFLKKNMKKENIAPFPTPPSRSGSLHPALIKIKKIVQFGICKSNSCLSWYLSQKERNAKQKWTRYSLISIRNTYLFILCWIIFKSISFSGWKTSPL